MPAKLQTLRILDPKPETPHESDNQVARKLRPEFKALLSLRAFSRNVQAAARVQEAIDGLASQEVPGGCRTLGF